METPFIYNRFVSGAHFLSRREERNSLTHLLRQNEHALIIDGPRTGKRSLVQQAFLDLKALSFQYTVCHLDLGSIRSRSGFLHLLAGRLCGCFAVTQAEQREFRNRFFPESARLTAEPLPPFADEDPFGAEACREILSAPGRIAAAKDTRLILYFEEFQNILLFDDPDAFLKELETAFRANGGCSCIFTGSMVNGMKHIFLEKKYFYRFAEEIRLQPLAEKDVVEHITKTFLRVGRVVEKDLAAYMYRTLKGHPWYLAHLSTICFNLTKGYLNDKLVQEALHSLMSIHVPRFRMMMNDLTDYQLRLLLAVLDGTVKFSTTDVIEQYRLNSSANVFRVKEALKKKEILTFDEQEIPHILDPLFELWLRTRYFKTETL